MALSASCVAWIDEDRGVFKTKPQSRSPCCIGVSAADVFLESLLMPEPVNDKTIASFDFRYIFSARQSG
jgi:hypothetical protein